jgi:hypothetical protein
MRTLEEIRKDVDNVQAQAISLRAELSEWCEQKKLELEDGANVWVRESHGLRCDWLPRHFAGWDKNGKMLCYPDGTTRHTCDKSDDLVPWDDYSLTDPSLTDEEG